MRNPFAGCGAAIRGERLVGRQHLVDQVLDCVAPCSGSIAIVGLPRIGKSSIALEAFSRVESEDGISALWIDASTRCVQDRLAKVLYEEMTGESLNETSDAEALLRKYLRTNQGFSHVVVVLDEFDAIRLRNSGDECIRFLREIIYRPHEFRLSAVLVSRRPLKSIQRTFNDLSTLSGVCQSVTVPPLDEESLNAMILRGWPQSSPIDSESLFRQSFGQPLLAEQILSAYWRNDQLDEIEEQARMSQHELFDDYYRVVESMTSSDSHLDDLEIRTVLRQLGLWERQASNGPSLFVEFERFLEKLPERPPRWETLKLLGR